MRRYLSLLPAALILLPAAGASAGWSAAAGGSASIGADVLSNASGFTAACTSTEKNSTVTLTWTPSPDAYVGQYEILRTSLTEGTTVSLYAAAHESQLVDAPPPTGAGQTQGFSYAIRAVSSSWTTAPLVAVGTPTFARGGRCSGG